VVLLNALCAWKYLDAESSTNVNQAEVTTFAKHVSICYNQKLVHNANPPLINLLDGMEQQRTFSKSGFTHA